MLTPEGKIDPARLEAIAFAPANNGYRKLTDRVGTAFRDGPG